MLKKEPTKYPRMNSVTSLSNLEKLKEISGADYVMVLIRSGDGDGFVFIFEFNWTAGGKIRYTFQRAFTSMQLKDMFMPASDLVEVIGQAAAIVWEKRKEELRRGKE